MYLFLRKVIQINKDTSSESNFNFLQKYITPLKKKREYTIEVQSQNPLKKKRKRDFHREKEGNDYFKSGTKMNICNSYQFLSEKKSKLCSPDCIGMDMYNGL